MRRPLESLAFLSLSLVLHLTLSLVRAALHHVPHERPCGLAASAPVTVWHSGTPSCLGLAVKEYEDSIQQRVRAAQVP